MARLLHRHRQQLSAAVPGTAGPHPQQAQFQFALAVLPAHRQAHVAGQQRQPPAQQRLHRVHLQAAHLQVACEPLAQPGQVEHAPALAIHHEQRWRYQRAQRIVVVGQQCLAQALLQCDQLQFMQVFNDVPFHPRILPASAGACAGVARSIAARPAPLHRRPARRTPPARSH
ncbi:hypothetical protein G6F35_016276 [Rhizopus arrhizus]|nr:hypothetical protein G6F35_016276 [Rhizopus arrhizus]